MNIKKLLVLHLLIMSSMTQPYDLKDKDLKNFTTTSLIVGTTVFLGYMWATSGDSVEERIADAQQDLATMPEYEQEFDVTFVSGEKESQIKANLKLLNIDFYSFDGTYNQKLQNDLETLHKTYNNLWFKSFYGGQEIVDITRKVDKTRVKIESLLKYLKDHQKFMHGHRIIHESHTLLSRSSLQNQNEIMKTAQSYDPKSTYPLFNYLKKIKKDLECIEFLITEKNASKDYPELCLIITEYQSKLEEIKNVIGAMEAYKHEALSKLEHDIALLTEQYKKHEQLIAQLQHEVRMLRMTQR